ncbi:hypothetical protein Tsubulata_038341 [Turnera subulata]|uniref:Protein TIC 22-like, chloroplastic n=1 Tax=Turnera subulata TaxID=218843 RepID=A0A9Q0GAY1_9ROSI|nr:hypothetical protein Tsubulata_038341 [Turnera subulata]
MEPSSSSSHHPLQQNLHRALTTLQSHCSSFLHNVSQNPHIQNLSQNPLLKNLSQNPLLKSLQAHPFFSHKAPLLAPTPPHNAVVASQLHSLPVEALEERLAGVPVYALCTSGEEFLFVSGASTGKSLALFCFKKEDAESLLHQMKSMDSSMRNSRPKVVPVALNKVFQLKLDGVAFRLIPESSQVKNALTERQRAGLSDDGFSGVPVFQSQSLVVRSQDKIYRPVFFRKEDLERALLRASGQHNKLNPAFDKGDIKVLLLVFAVMLKENAFAFDLKGLLGVLPQLPCPALCSLVFPPAPDQNIITSAVAAFEEVLKNMKDTSISAWDDVVFIPPGFDVSTNPTS